MARKMLYSVAKLEGFLVNEVLVPKQELSPDFEAEFVRYSLKGCCPIALSYGLSAQVWRTSDFDSIDERMEKTLFWLDFDVVV